MNLSDVMTEGTLMEELGLTKSQVAKMRERGLTYIALSYSKRLYDATDVVIFLEKLKRARVEKSESS